MTGWHERSRTEAAMLNPALVAAIVANAALQYHSHGGHSMPWPLSFVVAPMVLHRGTREALPTTSRTNLGAWVADHPVEHAGFARRALSLRDPVQEGIRFGLQNGLLHVDSEGCLTGTLASGRGHTLERGSEAKQIVAKAGFVGKWLAKVDQPATTFVVLGVAP
ncbi:three component ABC system middle component [Kocuria sp. ICS0012]|uniref:three component ABC system middle component n=1 Tax=Kocuria sp. ICS0012 TaxID=1834155 RepID=UPI003510C39F